MTVPGTDEPPDAVLAVRADDTSGADAASYERAARPGLAFAGRLRETVPGASGADGAGLAARTAGLAREGGAILDRFENDLRAAGAPLSSLPPARLALGLIMDQAARANPALDLGAWAAAAQRHLFAGQPMSLGRLRQLVDKAVMAGPKFAPVHAFLSDCLRRAQVARLRPRAEAAGWGGMVLAAVLAFLALVLGWAIHAEWTFHNDLNTLNTEAQKSVEVVRPGPSGVARRLSTLAEVRERTAQVAERAPIALAARPFGFDATMRAEAAYVAALGRDLPQMLAQAVDLSLATEGDGSALYDTLRAWDILSGRTGWSAVYLRGWLRDRPEVLADYQPLVKHVAALPSPGTDQTRADLPQPDAELLAQARDFAAEAPEEARAYLELVRADAVAAVPDWDIVAVVPGIDEILLRRSGRPLQSGIDGLFTAAGWDHARREGAGLAVALARSEAARMYGQPLSVRNDTPDRVLARLQEETLSVWRGYLADLRVRPFTDRAAAIRVSGGLSARNSPLERLLLAVWQEVGGRDRQRPHPLQLRIATEFGPMIQYVEQGGLLRIAELFAALNVALGGIDSDEATGLERLMSVAERSQSISALGQAPAVVVQIVEDVLAQSSASHADMLSNPLTRRWQAQVLPLCRTALSGVYPVDPAGPDADLRAFADLLGPGGAIDAFLRRDAQNYIDTTGPDWRWKPEARFAGLEPDSARFLQRATAIRSGFFPQGPIGAELTLVALAERGRAFVRLGGQGAPVEAGGAAAVLHWPGGAPEQGVAAQFETADGPRVQDEPGPWGLFRLLDGLRVRERDAGQRYLVDLRIEGARLFLELGFARSQNPVSARPLLQGLECPTAL